VTPAMAAGVTDRLWEISDIVRLLEEREARVAQEQDESSYSPFMPAKGPKR